MEETPSLETTLTTRPSLLMEMEPSFPSPPAPPSWHHQQPKRPPPHPHRPQLPTSTMEPLLEVLPLPPELLLFRPQELESMWLCLHRPNWMYLSTAGMLSKLDRPSKRLSQAPLLVLPKGNISAASLEELKPSLLSKRVKLQVSPISLRAPRLKLPVWGLRLLNSPNQWKISTFLPFRLNFLQCSTPFKMHTMPSMLEMLIWLLSTSTSLPTSNQSPIWQVRGTKLELNWVLTKNHWQILKVLSEVLRNNLLQPGKTNKNLRLEYWFIMPILLPLPVRLISLMLTMWLSTTKSTK